MDNPTTQAHPLLTLGRPGSPDRRLLDHPGAFTWWYLDALDADGNGLVLVWSFGLPFLPGALGAARAGLAKPPAQRPSFNIALYERGRCTYYLLSEVAEREAEWSSDGGDFRFAGTHIRTWTRDGQRRVDVQVDCPIPGGSGRLRGRVALTGPELRSEGEVKPVQLPLHEWTPMVGPSQVQATLEVGPGGSFTYDGPGYHDRNSGCTPLDQLGIDRWTWARTVSADRLRVLYALWPETGDEPETWALEVDRRGEIRVERGLAVEARTLGRSAFGLTYLRSATFADGRRRCGLDTTGLLESGPFYIRSTVNIDGEVGLGEWVYPRRIDRAWRRPLVRMRVHKEAGPNSFWLPLFSGPRVGRVRRLLGLEGGRSEGLR